MEMTENTIIESGKFKPKKKLLGFVSGTGTNIRIITDVANIQGKKLSGTLEGSEFQLKLYPDGTVDFTQISGEGVSDEMLERLLEEISTTEITSYYGKSILYGYDFKNSEGLLCYLEVEYETPIQKLAAIFQSESKNPSKRALDILDSLFGNDESEDEDESSEIEEPTKSNVGIANQFLSESFNKMSEDKILELKSRIEKSQSEIQKTKFEIKSGEDKLHKLSEDFRILNSRLKSMTPNDPPNGWNFNVSEKVDSDVEMSPETLEIIEKLSKVLNLVPEKVQKVIADGHYNINFTSESEESMPIEILKKVSEIDPIGTISRVGDFEFQYSGELTWHEIVDVLIKMGFEKI